MDELIKIDPLNLDTYNNVMLLYTHYKFNTDEWRMLCRVGMFLINTVLLISNLFANCVFILISSKLDIIDLFQIPLKSDIRWIN